MDDRTTATLATTSRRTLLVSVAAAASLPAAALATAAEHAEAAYDFGFAISAYSAVSLTAG